MLCVWRLLVGLGLLITVSSSSGCVLPVRFNARLDLTVYLSVMSSGRRPPWPRGAKAYRVARHPVMPHAEPSRPASRAPDHVHPAGQARTRGRRSRRSPADQHVARSHAVQHVAVGPCGPMGADPAVPSGTGLARSRVCCLLRCSWALRWCCHGSAHRSSLTGSHRRKVASVRPGHALDSPTQTPVNGNTVGDAPLIRRAFRRASGAICFSVLLVSQMKPGGELAWPVGSNSWGVASRAHLITRRIELVDRAGQAGAQRHERLAAGHGGAGHSGHGSRCATRAASTARPAGYGIGRSLATARQRNGRVPARWSCSSSSSRNGARAVEPARHVPVAERWPAKPGGMAPSR